MDDKKNWLINLMRLGFMANGLVYLTIGILAFQAAVGAGGKTSGSQGALASIASQPFGQILLTVITIGLVGISIWYIIRGVLDPDDAGDDIKGMAKRFGLVVAGLGYSVLAFSAFRILTTARSGGGNQAADWTAVIMQQSYGKWIVSFVGIVIIGVGVYQLYKAYQTKFRQKLNLSQMSPTETKWGIRAGQVGIAARAIIFGIMGSFLVQAALQADPQQAGGVGKALQSVANQSYGSLLLGVIAFGLMAYGLYSAVVLARYRDIQLN